MDDSRFDALARTLTTAGSRRRILGSFSAAAVGALGSVFALPRAEAKKRHNKRNAKKHDGKKGKDCPTCETCPEPPTMPTCKQRCGSCDFCLTQTDGPYLCGEYVGYPWDYTCDQPVCTSNNDCVGTNQPYCLTRLSVYDPTSGDFTDGGAMCPDGGARCIKINHACAA